MISSVSFQFWPGLQRFVDFVERYLAGPFAILRRGVVRGGWLVACDPDRLQEAEGWQIAFSGILFELVDIAMYFDAEFPAGMACIDVAI